MLKSVVMDDLPERKEAELNDAALLFEKDKTFLILDDDKAFLNRLAKAMTTRGFIVSTAETVADALAKMRLTAPAFAIIDMRLTDGNGIDVVTELKALRPEARCIILTGYANISSAVIAIKLAPFDYLAKPADADEIFLALYEYKPSRRRDCAGKSDVRGTRPLGAYPENLRIMRTKRLGDGAAAEHASTHPAEDLAKRAPR